MRCCADDVRRPRRRRPATRGPASRTASTPSRTATAPIRPGTARAALRHRVFRRVFIGAFLSNIGTWMQNVVLGALAYDLTDSPTFVGVLLFAQLGPLLLFSLVGGLLADVVRPAPAAHRGVDRCRACSPSLLALRRPAATTRRASALVAIVFVIGMGQAVFGPTYSALLPVLVGREDLAGAISLNSAQMNGSRVIGPAIGRRALRRSRAPAGSSSSTPPRTCS